MNFWITQFLTSHSAFRSFTYRIGKTTDDLCGVVGHFSVILKSKTKPAIIVEPKNREQNFVQTKTDVTSRIDPVDAKIQIQRVKSIKNGGMLIGCSSSDQNSRFKQLAQEKLSESYVIREVKGVSPPS